MKRKIKRVKVKLKDGDDEVSQNVDDDNPFSSTSGFVNFMYRWNTFYIPFGFSYSNLSFKETGSESGFGANVGVGWQMGSWTYLELMVSSISFDSEKEMEGMSLGQANLANVAIQFKFHFF